ncbi:MAG TPA: TetR/AcrR family transcriptional regulator [Lichenihabitans sp.]|jgi:AcrR family transcriptional regulator|nr:TetR/AcrR family transcriptional regulator [Lichenihabitans sp.]
MARTIGSSGAKTMEAISSAGLDLIFEFGYEGMSLRQLAARVGIRQGSLYNHIQSKQDLLLHLYDRHMRMLHAALDTALTGAGPPAEQLATFVDFHVSYHVQRKREVFVVNSELRSLEPANYGRATELRRQYERRLIDILDGGAADGTFEIADAPVTAYGILGMLSGICTWYDPRGRLDRAALSALYVDMVLKSVRAVSR